MLDPSRTFDRPPDLVSELATPGLVLMDRQASAVTFLSTQSSEPTVAQFQAADWAIPAELDLGDGDVAAKLPLVPLTRYSSGDFCANSTVQASVLFPHDPHKARASASAR